MPAPAVVRSVPVSTVVRGGISTGLTPPNRSSGKGIPSGGVIANDNRPYLQAPQRHKESPLLHGADAVAEKAGEGLFGYAFMGSIAGFVARNTIGRVTGWINKGKGHQLNSHIGLVTFAPAQALDRVSFAQLREHGFDAFKQSYWGAAADYAQKNSVGSTKFERYAAGYAHVPERTKMKWSGFKNVPKWLAHKPLFSVVMGAGLALGSALALVRAGGSAKDGVDDLKEVAEDLTGQPVSRMQLINGDPSLPPIIQEMQANLKAHLVPDAVGAVGSVIEKGAFAAMGGPATHAAQGLGGLPMAGMMGGMMLGNAANEFKPAQHFVNSYLAIKDLQAQGQAVAPEYYAALIASASPEARRVGGSESRQVQALAEEYAKENASARMIVNEIAAHEPFKKRVEAISKKLDALDKATKKTPAHDGPIGGPEANAPAVSSAEITSSANEKPSPVALESVTHEGKMQAPNVARGAS